MEMWLYRQAGTLSKCAFFHTTHLSVQQKFTTSRLWTSGSVKTCSNNSLLRSQRIVWHQKRKHNPTPQSKESIQRTLLTYKTARDLEGTLSDCFHQTFKKWVWIYTYWQGLVCTSGIHSNRQEIKIMRGASFTHKTKTQGGLQRWPG